MVMAEVTDPAVAEPVGLLAQVIDSDTEPDPDCGGDGGIRLREGVAPDRVISVSDPEMRMAVSPRRVVSMGTRWT
jgi:hypothetical protein